MNRFRIVLFIVLSVLVASCSGTDEFASNSLIGVWNGEVSERDVLYDLSMRIARLDTGRAAGTATYSGAVSCVGTLTFEGDNDGVFAFRETVDDETVCADGGWIEVWRGVDGSLQWEWFRSEAESQPDAVATLRRGA